MASSPGTCQRYVAASRPAVHSSPSRSISGTNGRRGAGWLGSSLIGVSGDRGYSHGRLQFSRPGLGWLVLVVLIAGFDAAPLAAQLAGRWILTIPSFSSTGFRGELRLRQAGNALTGTIWLGSSERPLPVTGGRIRGDSVEFGAAAGPRFIGRIGGAGDLAGRIQLPGQAGPEWVAAPLPEDAEFYPALPRFTVRGVVTGRRDSLLRIAGPWLAAARRLGSSDSLLAAYHRAADAAGLSVLRGDSLATAAQSRALGVWQRADLVDAAVRTLTSVRAGLTDAGVRGRFDRLFRPRGVWQVDLHDVALARARAGMPSLRAESALPALRAVGWLPAQGGEDAGTLDLALYRLFTLKTTDTAMARTLFSRMAAAEPASASALARLMGGYDSAAGWYTEAIRFFLDEPWLPGHPARSIGDAVRAAWNDSTGTPILEARPFGYPQAVPRYGVPGRLFEQLVHADNWAAEEWLRRHGRGGFLQVLHRVTIEYGPGATLELPHEIVRLASPRGLTGQDDNGFLEARDAITIDPGYFPLLAIGAVVHEWQHLLFQRRLLAAVTPDGIGPAVLPGVDPFVVEGLAEWRAEVIMAPFTAREPLLGVAESEKRARLARSRPDDQHVLGYSMVRALAAAVGDDSAVVALLERAAVDPRGTSVLADPRVARAWAALRREPDRTIVAPSRRALVPELTFTIEDEFPDLLRTRIVVPHDSTPGS